MNPLIRRAQTTPRPSPAPRAAYFDWAEVTTPGRVIAPARRAQRSRRAAPALTHPASPLTVLVRPELLRTIATSALTANGHETGGPLLGTVQRSWETTRVRLVVSILGTVPPGPRVNAGPSSVAFGGGGDGERAASALRWLRLVTGLDLMHLGDWHKHHGSPEPSTGDRLTAERMRSECEAPIWLTAITLSKHGRSEDASADGHLARYARRWNGSADVAFYRESGEAGLVRMPIRIEKDVLPCLPALPWHVADPARFAAELRLLQAAKLKVAIDAAQPDKRNTVRPGLAIRIHGDDMRPLTVITGPRYPQDAPVALDDRGRRILSRRPWSPDQFLVDLVKSVR